MVTLYICACNCLVGEPRKSMPM